MNRSFISGIFTLILVINHELISLLVPFLTDTFQISGILLQMIVYTLVYCIPMLLYILITKEPVKITFSLKPLGFRNIILIILISIVIQPLIILLSSISSLIYPNNVSTSIAGLKDANIFYLVLTLAGFPALFEELYFRGIVFFNYRNIPLNKAMLATGLAFGMMHDGQQFLYAFAMGVVFCYFVYKTKSIFASMLSHFVINSTQTIWGIYVANNINAESTAVNTYTDLGIVLSWARLAIVTLPCLFILFMFFSMVNREPNPLTEIVTEDIYNYNPVQKNKEEVFNIPLAIVSVIFIVFVLIPPFLSH